jgi:hypothetical protein
LSVTPRSASPSVKAVGAVVITTDSSTASSGRCRKFLAASDTSARLLAGQRELSERQVKLSDRLYGSVRHV